MKKLSLVIMAIAALSITWVSCNKVESSDTLIETESNLNGVSLGNAHNELLSIYFDELASSNTRTHDDLTLDDKILIIDDYFYANNYGVSFSYILENSPEIYSFLAQMQGEEKVEADYRDIFQQLNDADFSTPKELEFHTRILDIIYEEATSADQKIMQLNSYKNEVEFDAEFSLDQRESLMFSIELGIASVTFWNEFDVDFIDTVPWYARDLVGAIYALTSGIGTAGAAVAGPAGLTVAVIGTAAISSMM